MWSTLTRIFKLCTLRLLCHADSCLYWSHPQVVSGERMSQTYFSLFNDFCLTKCRILKFLENFIIKSAATAEILCHNHELMNNTNSSRKAEEMSKMRWALDDLIRPSFCLEIATLTCLSQIRSNMNILLAFSSTMEYFIANVYWIIVWTTRKII